MNRADKYKHLFTKDFLMGPNSVRLLDEMLSVCPLRSGSKVMDLGCGKGLTSLFLVNEANVDVFAVDLWISASDNYRRFREWNISEKAVPIHADAHDLPFADEYFDAIVSIDSFHYFSTQKGFFNEKILPLLKKDGLAVIAMPGLKNEIHGNESELMLEWVNGEESEYELFHSLEWWKAHLGKSGEFEIENAFELDSFSPAWNDWFASGHEFALHDEKYFARGIDKYLAIIGLVIRKK